VRSPLAAALVALAFAAGCGGDDDSSSGVQPLPAAGELTPGSNTPGVPTGASYDISSTAYMKLSAKGTVRAASDYVDDHPKDCEGADPGRVAAYAFTAIGTDFPLTAPVADALNEGCAADLQS
jgi:hypothetical protein